MQDTQDTTVGIRLTGISEAAVEAARQLLFNLNITWGAIRQEDGKYWYIIGRVNDIRVKTGDKTSSYTPKEEVIGWD
jgi:hypothetical protein